MSNMPLPFKSGDEQDYLTSWRRCLIRRAGTVKRIKRSYRRRVRAYFKLMLRKFREQS